MGNRKRITWDRKAYAIIRALFSVACVPIVLHYYSTERMLAAFQVLRTATMAMWNNYNFGVRAFVHSSVPYLDALAGCLLFVLIYGGMIANAIEAVRIWQGKEVLF